MNKHKDDLLPTLATAIDAYVKAKVEEALMDERARSQSMHRRAQKAEAAVARVTQWLDVIENGTRGNEYYIRCVVEWLRKAAAINGKTFTVLSDDGEAWKARAIAAEAKANVMVADKINLRSELLSVEAKLAKAVEALEKTQKHVNWMENSGSRLNRFVFDYIDDTLAEIGEP